KLHRRLKDEQRLVNVPTGDNTDFTINFIPKMNTEALINGYRTILRTIYAPKHYYARVRTFLKEYRPAETWKASLRLVHIKAFLRSIVRLGIIGRERYQYWKLFFWSLFRRPRLFPLAITLSIYGFHFRKVLRHHEKRLAGS
ncbi:MAG TPA: DUF4070 domain-containing protein, partial [Nitrospirota bacterium]|nr:DUF4070 domain-containing protein [Nitrospirota bacterium]